MKKNIFSASAVLLLVAGCAGAPAEDPLEPYNRAMFSFNEKLDNAALKPVAKGYKAVTPAPVRTWVSNFFGNLQDPWIGVNNLLQGKPADALNDLMRFVFNSTLGIGGLLDIASEAQMPKHDEDFGQTLGVWGVKDGPFVVLPLFGPRMLRDAAAIPADWAGNSPWSQPYENPIVHDDTVRYGLSGLNAINGRANMLGLERTLDEGTLDKYRFARDFYIQQRRFNVHDGNPPLEEYEDFDSDEGGDAAQDTGENP
ncbi:MAG: VacJ family lipoprotein [Azoarcus sp.]|jgi:phospholipid-binding lipoprotein MlaA|nr:VacJ family lipoprotein [Azoarcus sp.]